MHKNNVSKREESRHYIPASEKDIQDMLDALNLDSLEALFAHLPSGALFGEAYDLPEEQSYDDVKAIMEQISKMNTQCVSFLGDGLPVYKTHPIVAHIAQNANLATAYTPYQPERSQGTLISHWIYQCLMSSLTGFEAINTSLYDRATALYEAICCALRMKPNADTVLLSSGLLPQDLEVVRSLVQHTGIHLKMVPLKKQTGLLDFDALYDLLDGNEEKIAAIAFPQINHFGLLEDVNTVTDIADDYDVKSIAVVDPALLATGGLRQPSTFGQKGANILVGEGQHLAIGPNFGGPGLGVFGVRYNEDCKNDVRQTPGRFVGKSKDVDNKECYTMVLSTREQHIRKDKATSNICSNQAFLATLAGAAILAKGEFGMSSSCLSGKDKAYNVASRIASIDGIYLAFPQSPFFNEFVVLLPEPAKKAIKKGQKQNLHIGVDISDRVGNMSENYLKISFSDLQTEADREQLIAFFEENYGKSAGTTYVPSIPPNYIRFGRVGIPQLSLEYIKDYYNQLGNMNISPKDTCYPLGSCTMKYNPLLNEYAANLPGFTNIHPQAPVEDVQGAMRILAEIQEWFKKITGLAAVTTQPVAGAQGELVALKMFQAYHKENSEETRDIVLIPKSAHGTNFASAAMAGYKHENIIGLDADKNTGCLDLKALDGVLAKYGERISGIMITNPNTSGIFETDFRKVADKIHALGGLVYMDGANLNAIAGWVNIAALGVDAIHSNLHKTWSIPHGGGGPGDAILAVSDKLADYLPGYQIIEKMGMYKPVRPRSSVGSFHRHWGNFAHKVRCYAYLLRLGKEGVKNMSATAVLASRYLFDKLSDSFEVIPASKNIPRMHEFIITLDANEFTQLEKQGFTKASLPGNIGKLFLDFGFHAPTVSFPDPLGLMIEPTESYTKAELDRFAEAVHFIRKIVKERPSLLLSAPHFMPIKRVDEVAANRNLVLSEKLTMLPEFKQGKFTLEQLAQMSIEAIYQQLMSLSA
ncbi:MAG: glycine dehydrogenase [Verrucomicrobia bacterium CG_4_10_14_3_um_filter_43_23]|nr:MAG: glycine dehydrogenase [Verrucomicrobia bacterium CG1_02_43_26]PIP59458.1 MAG: glycine dehydrogenase [Verrucomicrobia bacterium CG22_combo_CG10-13_8_21_14_all_43_17]PIX58619.1 MAG: glycine dehydrogenase [Verrucomicrobia bacterium CG_4_10_14_3_um_filter_43_23]PIY61444.1 MAG: glycine dehydrogenase [Verrucomicrobia bacterium CG_4_10_14_0_8_um_filter_43_34]PJA43842.1 MAG: glycine dehydrogenase [Verrucomicrobia bacterium CG_4_9_14_3_um_filter_43_20]